ncbi:phosphotransferase [Shewanella cyperi]|uniref:Phosphotransferase n=2 Tax=Shewanella cyperi TaxID=2814292 RepID=A0A974XLQ0_9GAMM|nr:phosphotransferase [Shewanella cyperi]QSX30694.1 phosphotransferase [Shewanella cyperi]
MPAIIKQFFAQSHEMTPSDPRFVSLQEWLGKQFAAAPSLQIISGDASFRRYFRATRGDQSFIVMDSPPQLIPLGPFQLVAKAYGEAGIPVPKILAAEPNQGFMLLEDLGDDLLLSHLTETSVLDWYGQALELLPAIASVKATDAGPLPEYDAEFVQRELAIFVDWLLEVHLQLPLDSDERAMLAQAFEFLAENALEQPRHGMHRDFHSRNLMLVQGKLAVLDFQDAVQGPITYDAVSLLRDCYVRWPEHLVEEGMLTHFELCHRHGLIPMDTDFNRYRRWFDLMGIQRHLKAAGIFARLNHRDNKPGYLKDIPLTLGYIRDVAVRYRELGPLARFINERVWPKVMNK